MAAQEQKTLKIDASRRRRARSTALSSCRPSCSTSRANTALDAIRFVTAQRAAARQGYPLTKTRGEASRRPQALPAGPGRARQGSTRAPQFTGGGAGTRSGRATTASAPKKTTPHSAGRCPTKRAYPPRSPS